MTSGNSAKVPPWRSKRAGRMDTPDGDFPRTSRPGEAGGVGEAMRIAGAGEAGQQSARRRGKLPPLKGGKQ